MALAETFTCPVCGDTAELFVRGQRRKYCSPLCRRRGQQAGPPRTRSDACLECGATVVTAAGAGAGLGGGRRRKFCSKKCRTKADNHKYYGGTYPLRGVRVACAGCGQGFTAIVGARSKGAGSRTYCDDHCRRLTQQLIRYGITPNEYREILGRQGGRCAICQGDLLPRACVDHHHGTGSVRGILCTSCNSGIGLLKDDPEVLRAAANYVERRR